MKLYGKNSVIERLRTNPKSIRQVFIQESHPEISYISKKARKWGIPFSIVPKTKILKLARNTNTQGILVEIEDFPYVLYSDLLELALKKHKTLVFLDNLNDPQNLGAIMRTLACLGQFAVVLPTHDSVEVTETVLRVASGGDNYVPVAKVANLSQAIRKAKEEGFFIVGAVVREGQKLTETQFPWPLGLVVGSEQRGIRDVILKVLDLQVSIPMAVDRMSFNVAQAMTILAYEISKQRK